MPKRTVRVTCSVEGCEGPAATRGMCQLHYQRWWAFGDPGPAERIKVRRGPGKCAADHCQRPRCSKGYCELHYRRLKRGVAIGSLRWLSEPKWAAEVTYHVAHGQIVARRGKASTYLCECGQPAKDWAYQHNDPDARADERGYSFSLKFFDCYEPMCRSCHNILDRDLDARAAAI